VQGSSSRQAPSSTSIRRSCPPTTPTRLGPEIEEATKDGFGEISTGVSPAEKMDRFCRNTRPWKGKAPELPAPFRRGQTPGVLSARDRLLQGDSAMLKWLRRSVRAGRGFRGRLTRSSTPFTAYPGMRSRNGWPVTRSFASSISLRSGRLQMPWYPRDKESRRFDYADRSSRASDGEGSTLADFSLHATPLPFRSCTIPASTDLLARMLWHRLCQGH